MRRLFALLPLLAASSAVADVKLPSIFSDHMVLQQQSDQTKDVAVWGWAEKGEPVEVTVGDAKAFTKTGDDGKWMVRVGPPKAGGPTTLVAKGKNTIEVKDVLVGEVWLCSGQSNMAFMVRSADNFEAEQKAANLPQMRQFMVDRTPNPEPQKDCRGKWEVCSPETVGAFTAAGYFMGRELHQTLKVPVGLINSSYGGTDIAAWTSKSAQEQVPELEKQMADWDAKAQTFDPKKAEADYQKQLEAFKARKAKAGDKAKAPRAPKKPQAAEFDQNRPANLFNGMINPLIPYTFRGAIWYQGERNSNSDAAGRLYRKQLPLLIQDWRTRFGSEFPFAFVQLPNFTRAGEGWQLVRESMLVTRLTVPQTGMAVTIDVGNPSNIHPTNKQAVGHRLAQWALADVYKQPGVVGSGPLPKSSSVQGDAMHVQFDYADGLKAKDGKPAGFELAGADGKFMPAQAEIKGSELVVSSPEVKEPKSVRYAWKDNPEASLINGAGLLASPFQMPIPDEKAPAK